MKGSIVTVLLAWSAGMSSKIREGGRGLPSYPAISQNSADNRILSPRHDPRAKREESDSTCHT